MDFQNIHCTQIVHQTSICFERYLNILHMVSHKYTDKLLEDGRNLKVTHTSYFYITRCQFQVFMESMSLQKEQSKYLNNQKQFCFQFAEISCKIMLIIQPKKSLVLFCYCFKMSMDSRYIPGSYRKLGNIFQNLPKRY